MTPLDHLLNVDIATFEGIASTAGMGLRAPHYGAVLATSPDVGVMEVHTENYFGAGGPPHRYLTAIAERYRLSFHGVGLSLGGATPLDREHLHRTKSLIDRYDPVLVTEHLCWSAHGGHHSNDLLPLPLTEEAVKHSVERLKSVQDFLGRPIGIENVSSYLRFTTDAMSEWAFVSAVAEAADCGILLDINNILVSAANHGFDPNEYLAAIPGERVIEYHLAGHSVNHVDGIDIHIDDHGHPASDETLRLYERALDNIGPRPTIFEWDSNLPELDELLVQVAQAQQRLDRHVAHAA